MTPLALFGDRNVLPALHVALASTLHSWTGPEPLEIHLFHRGLHAGDLALLQKTLSMAERPARFHEAVFDITRVAHWRTLYGSAMPYGRLFLPQLLPQHDEVIYLDADVVVDMDILKLRPETVELVAAMPAWDFDHSQDAQLAAEFGIAGTETYYHSGALVVRLDQWRAENLLARCLEFGDRYSDRLRSHDQTILNIVCRGRITPIPPPLTTHLYPTALRDETYPAESIRNFCGSPKPFDPLGNVLNSHYSLFEQWISRTALAGWTPNNYEQLANVRRNLRLLPPMVSTAARMLRNVFRR
ncbi:MAG TPA: glycosyltransferase [Thermoanaerobaculia bacterium]|nr:glycosyltransferase [Thermoanaerobaculia bacterium]